MDNDAGDIAEGNKPVKIQIGEKEVKVFTWQDVFIQFINFIKKDENYDFQFVIANQTELFNNDNIIISWSILEKMIEKNGDLSNRYKTLDGITWDKVKKLNSDTLFLHTNISASTCMNRISNIMNKFSIDEDFIRITLK